MNSGISQYINNEKRCHILQESFLRFLPSIPFSVKEIKLRDLILTLQDIVILFTFSIKTYYHV